MIIYATDKTISLFNIKMPSELDSPFRKLAEGIIQKESGDKLFEWGAKIYYFDKRKCLQVVNFASKLTLFIFDLEVISIPDVANLIANYLFELYKDDLQMTRILSQMFETNPFCCYSKLTDKSIISTLNLTETDYTDNGSRFNKYLRNNVLNTLEINHDVNFKWLFTMDINGKKKSIFPGVKFKKLMIERYGKL